jgi:hypothetical protein
MMDCRSPIRRLKSVDFPTFGLPTMATMLLMKKRSIFVKVGEDK